ncbi:MAG: hypothetical protein Q8R11_04170 [bacterium]|nr:hypothetical protein [bacterium]
MHPALRLRSPQVRSGPSALRSSGPSARGFMPVFILLLLVIFLVGLGGALIIFRERSGKERKTEEGKTVESAGASIRVVPDKQEYSEGDVASFAVFVDSRGIPVIGVDFEFSYDPSAITIEQSGVITSEVFPRFLGGFNQTKDFVDPATGTISIGGLIATESQAKAVASDQPVVIIQGIVEKSGKLTAEFTKGATDDTNVTQAGESMDILTEVESASFTVVQ